MKKILIIVAVFTSFCNLNAQSYLGYLTDNYTGVHGIISNPANIVDSRFKTDINLVSASVGVTNDFYGLKILNAINNANFDFDKDAKKSFSENNNAQSNVDVLGPSFMFNLAPKHSIALSSRGRYIANVSNVNGVLFNNIVNDLDTSSSFKIPTNNFNVVANAWAEFGLTYATILEDSDKHFFKAGVTVKYLSGLNNLYENTNNLSVDYNNTNLLPSTKIITTTGNLTVGGVDSQGNINRNDLEFNRGTGFGADLGFIYEYRPNIDELRDLKERNKYLIKIGFSVTDFGSINYNNNLQRNYNLNGSFSKQEFDNNDFDVLLRTKYTSTISSVSKYNLPTSAHLNFDWNMFRKFYLNLNADYNINSKTVINTNTIGNNYAITPRFESKWFSFFIPLNVMEYSGFQAGAGFRLGPLTVGSGSIITNLTSDNSKAADVYLGLKIPVYQGRIKDRDNDGVLDKKDNCPDEFGPIENNGCPYKDSDKDGTLDKDDKCIDVAGPKENNGCPYLDTDKDEVLDKDDKCVNEAGPKENMGCPYLDTDNDTVLDKDDKCPTVFGTKANNGCPEEKIVEPVKVVEPAKIQDEVIKKINEFSKTILFDSGKATIKPLSFISLDAIVSVLNEYQNANFKIEGHTDNVGIPAKNLMLSKNRAAAVKQYLIDKGVRNDRLTSEGFGSTKPIASNKTPKGKNANRRVEINLVK